ncbi:helix-turn-helix domain-containing protein [Streptomyces sp. S07_1.15]|uniref:helix-turn-helix domain-containing protein n=1 Tax=Streptomyces sp. S07_1.15 TaxID=2873925 RepID=UPI001D14179B|nr:helix-turn-helix domain-containing protein [Streptomyces sp. S07_1.15]MCC3654747.1 helix-turn-helix domain-containing protein [Streptomyces sp. S07_1.15]
MASAAQLAARPVLPRLPDGTYAVQDPHDPEVTTLWRVDGGALHPWPLRQRWAPRPPKADPDVPPEERRARRERWYAEVYWPWKLAVAEEIRRAPLTAADLFERLVPEHERPRAVFAAILDGRPTREELDEAQRQEEEADRDHVRTVAVLAAAGLPYRHIARAYRVSPSTAWTWARRGAELWHQEGGAEALAAALAALPPLEDLKARTAAPAVSRARQETPGAPSDRPLPEVTDEEFTAWAHARFGVDPEDLTELLDVVAAADWTELEDVTAADAGQLAALLDDLPDEDPGA